MAIDPTQPPPVVIVAPVPSPPVPVPVPPIGYTGARLYLLLALVAVVVGGFVTVVVALLTHHDLNDPTLQRILGYGVDVIAVLLAGLGLSSQVRDVHLSLNSRLDQFLASTFANGFQQGAASTLSAIPPAPPAAPITPPPAPPVGG